MFNSREKNRRILIFGILTLLSLLLIGAARMELALADEAAAAERAALKEVMTQATQIPDEHFADWKRTAESKPILMLKVSTGKFSIDE